MKRLLLALALVFGCVSTVPAGEFLNLATGILAMRKPKPAPVTPGPAPAPSGICDNCNGVGKVGDTKTMVTCPVCGGSGKKTTAPPPPAPPVVVVPQVAEPDPPPALPHYPIRRNWWSGCGNWRHLTVGPHAGKFDHTWLQSLSNEELQSLHSDDHEGRTKWEYVVRPQQAVQPKATAPPRANCPTGDCPSSSGGLFRQWTRPRGR